MVNQIVGGKIDCIEELKNIFQKKIRKEDFPRNDGIEYVGSELWIKN